MNSILQDLRYGLRMLGKSPGFTAIAIITLALGIGANTAIFSAVNGIVLKPLPYADSSRLVDIYGYKIFPNQVMATINFDPGTWVRMRAQTPVIEQMGFYKRAEHTLTGEGDPELLSTAEVSSDFFPTMGARPIAGRYIVPGDTQPGAKAVAVISYSLWRSRFSGDNNILARSITLDDQTFRIVGVMPPDFVYPILTNENNGKGVWLPLTVNTGVDVVARLKRGVSLAAANAQLKTISARMSASFKGFGAGGNFAADRLTKSFSDLDSPLLILLGAVGFVLLIACVNVSGLLLARGSARQREVAIRNALGASRGRIVRQFFTESVLLALGGGALGLFFAVWGVRVLQIVTPNGLPEHGSFLVNSNILWFALGVSLLTAILFGLTPVVQAAGSRMGRTLQEGFGASLAGISARRPRRLRSVLVVIEIALAIMLVIGATLVARSFKKITSVDLGFRTDHIITMGANFNTMVCGATKTLPECRATIAEILGHMRALPGVQSAAVASRVPLEPWSIIFSLQIEGHSQKISLDRGAMIGNRLVSPGYFQTFGIRVLAGRDFTNADVSGSSRICIVDEAFAKKYLGGDAVGRRISSNTDDKKHPEWVQIVGVVQTTHDMNIQMPSEGEVYFPFEQVSYYQGADFAARTATDPMAIAPALREAIWSVSKGTPVTDLQTMDQIVSGSVAEPRFQALLLASFGGLGLILAMVGIYGVISYGVTQRTREIGLRMALGAQPGNVLKMILREGMFLAGAGIVIGIGGALALGRVLESLLFEIKPTDPATFICVTIALAAVALAACYIPARRAMKVDPMVALRYE